jgi:hypothetical protein
MGPSDVVSKAGELLFPWGGVAVTVGAAVGTIAAVDASGPKIESKLDPTCPQGAFDLSCYDTTVSPGAHESLLGSWVPEGWVGMEAAVAGFIAALMVLAALGVLAGLKAAAEASQAANQPGP